MAERSSEAVDAAVVAACGCRDRGDIAARSLLPALLTAALELELALVALLLLAAAEEVVMLIRSEGGLL